VREVREGKAEAGRGSLPASLQSHLFISTIKRIKESKKASKLFSSGCDTLYIEKTQKSRQKEKEHEAISPYHTHRNPNDCS